MSGSTAFRVAGVVSLAIDGESWDVKGPLSYMVSDSTVETVKGQSGVVGYSELPSQGAMSMKLFDRGDEAVATLAAKRNATITAVLANGKTVYGSNMWRVGEPPDVDTLDNSFDIKFEGISVTESPV